MSFVEQDDDAPPAPPMVDLNNPYSCKKVFIEIAAINKRMFWCKSRRYVGGGSALPIYYREKGFFIAGSREIKGRVFLLQPIEPDDQSVYVVGQLDNVSLILGKKVGVPVTDDSPLTSSSSSSSSELF